MLESSSLSTPGESAASSDEGGTSRRAPAREPAESIGFGHLPERDFFALSLDTTLLSVEFPDEADEAGEDDKEDSEAENDAAAPNDVASPVGDVDGEAEPATEETSPPPDAVPPPADETEDIPALIQERALPPEDASGPDISAALSELEKLLAELAPGSHAPSVAHEEAPAASPVEKPHAEPPDVPISIVPAPIPPASSGQPGVVLPRLKIADDTLLPLPDVDIAPFIPDQPVVPPSTGIENIPTDTQRTAVVRKTPYFPSPSPPTKDRAHSRPARPAVPPVSPRPRPHPARTAPLEATRPGRVAPGRNTRPTVSARSVTPEADALHTLAELRRLLSELAVPESRNGQAASPVEDRDRARPAPARRPPVSSSSPAARGTTVPERPAPPPAQRFARLAGIPLVDPDPPAPASRAVIRDLSVPPRSRSMPVKDEPFPADTRGEAPRPGVATASRTTEPEPSRAPGWPTRLAARLKRLLRRPPRRAESISAAETPIPAPHQEHPARQADARPSRERAAPQPAVAKPVPVPAFSEAPSASAPPRPETQAVTAFPGRTTAASRSGAESFRPESAPQPVSGTDVPGRTPASVPDAPSVPAPPKIDASSPDLAPRASWPARLLARLKRGRAAPPLVSDVPPPVDNADDAPRSGGLLQRLQNMEAEHRARLLRLTDRPRGPVYPSREARRHLLDISLVDEEPSPNMEKEREPGAPLHVLRDDARSASGSGDWKMLVGVAVLTAVAGALLYAAMNPAQLDLGLELLRGLRL